MPISLYDVSIGSYLHTLDALTVVLDKALGYFQEKKIDPAVIVGTRLYPRHAALPVPGTVGGVPRGAPPSRR